MKRLLIFHPVIAPYRIDLFNEFSKRFDAKICLFRRNLNSQKFDYSKIEAQFNFKPTYVERSQGFLRWVKSLISQLREFNPDVVICSEFGVATLVAILFKLVMFKSYDIISIVDDSYNMVAEGNQFSRKHAWATRVMTPLLKNVINVEPRVVNFYRERYGKGIYMPIIVDEQNARERLQRILPISCQYVVKYSLEGKKVLLFVGRLVDIKNISFALRAFILADIVNSAFVIVGDGPEKESLMKIAEGHSNILFTGRLEGDALYAWYNVAQVFTLPSVQEPFGAVTNEALLGGCYALVSRLAGSNCLVVENVNGNIVDPYDLDLFVRLIQGSFEKIMPISLPLNLRENRMQCSFEECFDSMLVKVGFDFSNT